MVSCFLNSVERDAVDTPEFQRLFRISQLGFVDLVYQTANHTRGIHSIGASSGTSWWGTFAKTFFQGFSPASIKRDLDDPTSCFNQFISEQAPEKMLDTPASQDAVHDTAAVLGTSTALTYAEAKVLTSPLSSGIVRGLVSYGEKANTAFAVYGIAMEVKAFTNEMISLSNGTCH
jgi:hypothetical protein